ncbi:hypothetical protein ACAF95_22835, partial [Escherichia coli]|nr:hypothetical protein [Escherichia coli]MDK7090085.1 hypothetical protein [Escherichia coli]
KIGPDPRNFNQRVSLGRNDLLIRTFPSSSLSVALSSSPPSSASFFAIPTALSIIPTAAAVLANIPDINSVSPVF